MSNTDNTELKIKETARKLFQQKGFDGVRIREIAEHAGINSALLHYYFRSKENLFYIIMNESIHHFFSIIQKTMNNRETSLIEKIEILVNGYIDITQENRNLALFVINELHSNPKRMFKAAGIPKELVINSHLFEQLQEQVEKKNLGISPFHFILNTISMSVMPNIASPFLNHVYPFTEGELDNLLNERRKYIPQWIKMILQIDN